LEAAELLQQHHIQVSPLPVCLSSHHRLSSVYLPGLVRVSTLPRARFGVLALTLIPVLSPVIAMDVLVDDGHELEGGSKTPVVRGARACTVCRAAKMKCVGAEDGQKQCQRCKRANAECVFEKHRRGRKPGSKLSEASKMLRRLERGLHSAKLKAQVVDQGFPADGREIYPREYAAPNTHFTNNELPPITLPGEYANAGSSRPDMDMDEDDEADSEHRALFPAKLIRKENQRNSFFRTILNPTESSSAVVALPSRPSYSPPATTRPTSYSDPINTGILDEDGAKVLFDLVFLRLNPFINLFDPALHTVQYVRSKCPFLFTTLIMAGAKFFRAEIFKSCQKLAHELAVRAFADALKSVEVVQAFACLTYWKDPDDNRTWTYIGYACRMAVELGLNRYLAIPPSNESEFSKLERRNRERTYLVLFIHDRSLSTQTGRSWMLPEDDLVRHAITWHEQGTAPPRPEDVIVAAFVQLRRLSSETTDMFYSSKGPGLSNGPHHDVNYDVVLRNCNGKLTQWIRYLRPSLQALSACCTSALDGLRIVSKDFPAMSMLLLRSSNTLAELHEGTAHEIHTLISKTADAYAEAAGFPSTSTSAAYHSRFLRSLLANDIFKSRRSEADRYEPLPLDPRLQVTSYPAQQVSPTHGAPPPYHFTASPISSFSRDEYSPDGSNYHADPYVPSIHHASELDAHYWKNMFLELGFGESRGPADSKPNFELSYHVHPQPYGHRPVV
ncbi:unnamed protein product, partial [Mycena citricolor]